ncbi:MAG TPA: QueG-associated DUF1730 domain-containing protein, partial [Candidatus Binataceae bacterium]|nr:QueG-associated DUF1730 domain-containing protein [Candidatus Binataceae bacterium]
MDRLEQLVVESARAHGFLAVGFARARRLDNRADFYARWLSDGRPAEMDYLRHDPERRLDPRRIDARFRSVISLAYPYPAPPSAMALDWRRELRGRIAAYATGRDYHRYVRKAARAVGESICSARRGVLTRVHVDTGAIFQREWAAAGRLGWFGRNTVLLNRDLGSYFFL